MDPFAFFKIAPNLTRRDAQSTEAAEGTPTPGLTADDGGEGFAQLVSGSPKPNGQSLTPDMSKTTDTQAESAAKTGEDTPAETIQVFESGRAQYWRNLLGAGESDARGPENTTAELQAEVDPPVDRAPAEAVLAAGAAQVAFQTVVATPRAPLAEAAPPALPPIEAKAIAAPAAAQRADLASIAPDEEPPHGAQTADPRPWPHALLPADAKAISSAPATGTQHTDVTSDTPEGGPPRATSATDPLPLPRAEAVPANRTPSNGMKVPVEGGAAPNDGAEIALESSDAAPNNLGSVTPPLRVPPASIGVAQVSAPESEARAPFAGSPARPDASPSPDRTTQFIAVEAAADIARPADAISPERGALPQTPVALTPAAAGKDASGIPASATILPKRPAPEPETHPIAPEIPRRAGEATRGLPADWTAVPAAVSEALTEAGSVISIKARRTVPMSGDGAAAAAAALPVSEAPRGAGATPPPFLAGQAATPPATVEEHTMVPAAAGDTADRQPNGNTIPAQTAGDRAGGSQPAGFAAVAPQSVTTEAPAANPAPSQAPGAPERLAEARSGAEVLQPSRVSQPASRHLGGAAALSQPEAGSAPAPAEETAATPEPRAGDRRDRREDRIEGTSSAGGTAPDKPMQATAQVDGSAARSGQTATGPAPALGAATLIDAGASVSPTAPSFAPQASGSMQAPVQTSGAAPAPPPPPALQIATAVASEGPGASQIDVSLSPEELGHVRLRLTHGEAGLSVAVTADRPETLDLLRRNIDTLARDFQDIGYGDVSFSFGDQPRQERPAPSSERGFSAAQPEFLTERDPDPTASLHPQSRLPDGGLDLRI